MEHPALAELLDGPGAKIRAHLRGCDSCRALSGLLREDLHEAPVVSLSLYRELGVLAVGGMGRASRAIDLRLGRVVALKEMKRPEPGLRGRFEREARLTARLQHPAIVSVYEAGRWSDPDGARDGDPFYAMELVEGRTLDAEIAAAATLEKRLALLPAVLRIVEAVAYAQEQGIVHRDIKPQNILIGRFGEAVLIDWGLAKDLRASPEAEDAAAPQRADEGSAALTEHGAGTAQYMSPQQARGEPVDPRFDVYALGATLYETLCGAPPYGAGTAAEVRARLAEGPPAPLAQLCPAVPRELETVVERAMAREAAQRFSGAQELASELRRFLAGQLVSSHDYSRLQLLRRRLRQPVVRVGVLAALLLLAVGGALSVRVLQERDQATAELARRLVDQGRGELERGSPLRALAFLGEARRRGADSPALRYLVGAALRPLEALRVTLSGHRDLIGAAGFSHDGRRVVTASADESARLWDAEGRPLAVLADHVEEVVSARFSDDDAQVLTGGADGFAKLWDAGSGALLRTLRADGIVFDAVFAPDGAIAVSTLAGTLQLWDRAGHERACAASSTQRLVYLSPDGTRALALDAGGAALLALPGCTALGRSADPLFRTGFNGALTTGPRALAAISSGSEVALLEPDGEGGLKLRALFGHSGLVLSVAFSPDGNILVSSSVDSTARAWDAQTGALIATFRGHTAQVRRAEVSRDGRLLVTAGGDGTARLWELRSGEQLATLEGHRNLVSDAQFSPDGRRVLTVSRDGSARIWDVETAVAVHGLPPHKDKLRSASFSPDSRSVLTAGDDGRVLLHAPGAALPRALSTGGPPVRAAGFSADGTKVFAVAADGVARVWTLPGEALPLRMETGSPLGAAALSPDQRLLAVGGAGGTALLLPLEGGAAIRLAGHTDEVSALAFSPDGALLATGAADGTARLWSVQSGALLATLTGHRDAVRSVAFASAGTLLTASSDGTARLWNVQAQGGAQLRQTLRHRGTVYSAVFSGDGARVLTAGADAAIRLWDAGSGALLRSIDTGGVPITSAAFSPDGGLLVSSSDRETALWDLATGARLAALPTMHGSEGNSASFSPDGRSVLILAHDDGRALRWDVSGDARSSAELSALVQARVPWRLSDGALLPAAELDKGAPEEPPAKALPGCGSGCFARGLAAELGEGAPLRDRAALDYYSAACAQGDSRGCARRLFLQPEQILDVLADGARSYVLYAVPTSSALVNAHYGVAVRGALVHLAQFEGGRARDLALTDGPLPVTGHAALGRDGKDLLAFFNLKRRGETYLCDGLLFRVRERAGDALAEVQRTQLFTEWNAGFHPFFEGAALHHYSYDDRQLVVDRDKLRPASFEEARAQQFRHRLAALGSAGEPGAVWSEWVLPRAQAAWLARREGAEAAAPGAAGSAGR